HTARATLLAAAPLLFAVAMRGFYGPGNGGMDVLLPVLIAGLAYGAVARLPRSGQRPAPPTEPNPAP
ncbi:hypothetical protein KDL67_09645, partial [bacterium]|nr:hypothetical protein [bacterium]